MPDGFQFDARTVQRLFDALAWYERQVAGARPPGQGRPVPIGTLRRFGVTCANPNTGVYPKPADQPNTYWFKFCVEAHDLAQGNQTRDETWLDDFPAPDATYPDGYWLAHNYTDGSPATKCYVPEGTLVLCSWHNERWWFQYHREEFWGRVTYATSLGTGQWQYTFSEVYKNTAGYGGWTNLPGGRSGYLYNSVEEVADPQAVQIPANAVVAVHEEYYEAAGTIYVEYWCQYEEFDQDASDGSPGSDGSGGGGGGHIDVVVCGGWNRCGQYIVLPQKRIAYDGRGNITSITQIANDVIPLHECESSGGEPPGSTGDSEPPDSGFGSSDFSFDVHHNLIVSGTLDPDATGTYLYRGYFNGKPFWEHASGGWFVYWSDSAGHWVILGAAADPYWYKTTYPETPLGLYFPAWGASGLATVSEAP